MGDEAVICDVCPLDDVSSTTPTPPAETTKKKKKLTVHGALKAIVAQLAPQIAVSIVAAVLAAGFCIWSGYLGEYSTIGAGASETSSERADWVHPVHVAHMEIIQFFLQSVPIALILFILGIQRAWKMLAVNVATLVLVLLWVLGSRGFWGIGEGIYIIPNYIAFIAIVIADGIVLARQPRWRFATFFAFPLLGTAIFLAFYDFSVLPWYASAATEKSRFLIRLFVQPIFFSVLLFFSKLCGFRAGKWKVADLKTGSVDNNESAAGSTTKPGDSNSTALDVTTTGADCKGVALIAAPLFISLYFGVFLSANLSAVGAFTTTLLTSAANFVIRLVIWNKYRAKDWIIGATPEWMSKIVANNAKWFFYRFDNDYPYGTFLVYEGIFEIASVALSFITTATYLIAIEGTTVGLTSALMRMLAILGVVLVFDIAYVPLQIVHNIPLVSPTVCLKHLPIILWIFFTGTTFVVYRSWLVTAQHWWVN